MLFEFPLLFAICVSAQMAPTPPPIIVVPPSTNPPIVSQATMLPIEVLGPPGSIETVELVSSQATNATQIAIQVHGLTYDGKASVRLNGGSWLTLSNANVTLPYTNERAFWGIGGPMSTLRIRLPVTNWASISGPTNEVSFRFNDLDGRSIGFRILSLDLLDDEVPLLATNFFAYDDPATWTPLSTNAADINAGSNAWFTLEIAELGQTLHAKCTDCHVRDGSDLKYFNYSTKSIVERSVFHGVPRATATNIASYILNLPVTYEANARPWNPVFQPGPGMDALPARSWPAGAGLTAVLTNDLDTLTDIFGATIATNDLNFRSYFVNAREIRIAMQLPDWNRWLPKVHPLDAYYSYYSQTNDNYYTRYLSIREGMQTRSGLDAAEYLFSKRSVWDRLNTTGGTTEPDPSSTNYWNWHMLHQAMIKFRNVKTFEFMKGWNLMEYGTEMFGALSSDRRWFHGELFQTGPHRLGMPNETPTFAAESMQWYQLQLVLNDGNRDNGGANNPIDWGYQHDLNFSAWNNPISLPTYGIAILNMVKGYEVVANDLPLADNHGWLPGKGKIQNLAPGNQRTNGYAQISLPLRVEVAEAVAVAWLHECFKYDLDTWAEAGWVGNLDFRTYVANLASNLDGIGVSADIINQIVDFGELLWPDYYWDPYRP